MSIHGRTDANRRNARLITGPKTTRGKARSSRNATKHGLFAKQQTDGLEEDAGHYQALVEETIARFGVETESERLFAEKIADELNWLRRCTVGRTARLRHQDRKRTIDAGANQLGIMANVISFTEEVKKLRAKSKKDPCPKEKCLDPKLDKGMMDNLCDVIESSLGYHMYTSVSSDMLAQDFVCVSEDLSKIDDHEARTLGRLERLETKLRDMVRERREAGKQI